MKLHSELKETFEEFCPYDYLLIRLRCFQDITPEDHVELLINTLKTHCTINQITVGYEELRSKFPNTGLPAKPHIHLHCKVQCFQYNMHEATNFLAFKKWFTRQIQRGVCTMDEQWGNNRMCIKQAQKENEHDIFRYPLKQYHKGKNENLRKFNNLDKLDEHIISATAKYEMNEEQSDNARKRREEDGMSAFYKDMLNQLETLENPTRLDILTTIYEFYVLKGKPINDQTIRGYALTYCFSHKIINLDEYIKNKHKDIL